MKLGDKTLSTFLLAGLNLLVISLSIYLADLILLRSFSISFAQIIFMGLLATLLLTPLYYWLRVRFESTSIDATELSDLELNERDVREAVSNWVYIHYNKKLEGDLEFSRDENGSLSCRVTVRNDS